MPLRKRGRKYSIQFAGIGHDTFSELW